MLAGKTVVLGVCGSIAAYWAMEIVGELRRRLVDVHVIMTRSATEFITPLSLGVISMNPVVVDMFADPSKWEVEHVSLAQRADIFLIAPATANTIGKIASGVADDMLTTTVVSTTAPVVIAPAMNEKMWLNPVVQANVETLKKLGFHIVDPEYGPMACGGEGWGRLASTPRIMAKLVEVARTLDR